MISFIKSIFSSSIFTWWNQPTVGTWLFTKRKGEIVGKDQFGNVYYQEKLGKRRWVIYKNGPVEASRVPPAWHAWLHYTIDDLPDVALPAAKIWEEEHQRNLSGTKDAYLPEGSLFVKSHHAKTTSEYEAWQPEQSK